ncbi:hypothetical protein B0H11DRAFT_1936408 [Mycena galericulata]|nr:hypothetical protein B0H11DRAFT_1936408 [Mycena galericulata]
MRERPPFRANDEVPNEEAQASGTPMLEEEAVAHAALRTLARKRQTSYGRVHAREFLKLICLLSSAANGVGEGGEPMTLSEIDAQSSSEGSVPAVCNEEVIARQRLQRQIRNLAADGDNYSERASDTSVCELARRRVLELKEQRRIRLAEKQERVLNEQRQREMRWLVNSGGRGSDRPSAEEFKIWGSKDSDAAVSYCTLPTTLRLGSGVGGIVCGAAERQSVERALQARGNRTINARGNSRINDVPLAIRATGLAVERVVRTDGRRNGYRKRGDGRGDKVCWQWALTRPTATEMEYEKIDEHGCGEELKPEWFGEEKACAEVAPAADSAAGRLDPGPTSSQ